MIQANELRIGNWLKSNLQPIPIFVKVDGISDDNVSAIGDYYLQELDPIKLTPEILEQCGFAKNSLNGSWMMLIDEHLWLDIYEDKTYLFFINPSEYNSALRSSRKIEHLHQLQNLYFSLTGEELKIYNNVAAQVR